MCRHTTKHSGKIHRETGAENISGNKIIVNYWSQTVVSRVDKLHFVVLLWDNNDSVAFDIVSCPDASHKGYSSKCLNCARQFTPRRLVWVSSDNWLPHCLYCAYNFVSPKLTVVPFFGVRLKQDWVARDALDQKTISLYYKALSFLFFIKFIRNRKPEWEKPVVEQIIKMSRGNNPEILTCVTLRQCLNMSLVENKRIGMK